MATVMGATTAIVGTVSELLLAPSPGTARAWGTRVGASVVAAGSCFPGTVVPTADIAGALDVESDWLVRRTGVAFRHKASGDERLTDVAASAARRALERAQVGADEVDLVIVATMTPDDLTPHTAAIVAAEIGARGAGAVDVNAACTGFLAALALAVGQVESGRAGTVVVIGADFMSRVLDYSDRTTAGIFGDGAGAVVVRGVEGDSPVGPILLESDGRDGDVIHTPRPSGPVRMDGQRTFRRAVDTLSDVASRASALVGMAVGDLDLAVFHQANARITKAVGERLGLRPERVVDCIAELGNTTSASLPTALAHADAAGTLHAGDRVLLAAFGAGLSWGGTVLTWNGAGAGAGAQPTPSR
jgi:3-oxoacyl-[acyl-carrier-protein] synthase-3